MVIDCKVIIGYRSYQVFWGGEGNLAEMYLAVGEDCVSEWHGEIDQILDTFEQHTGFLIGLPM